METAKKAISRMCARMDVDRSGTLSLEELLAGFDSSVEFRNVLNVLDVEKDDMECVFHIMDNDGSGDVSYEEFVNNLYRMKSQNSRTLLVFIKFYVLELRRNVQEQLELVKGEILTSLQNHSRLLTALQLPGAGNLSGCSSPDKESFDMADKVAVPTSKTNVEFIGSLYAQRKGGIKDDGEGASYVHRMSESDQHIDRMLQSSEDMLRNMANNDMVAECTALLEVTSPNASTDTALNPSSVDADGGQGRLESIPGALPLPPGSVQLQHPQSSPPVLRVGSPGHVPRPTSQSQAAGTCNDPNILRQTSAPDAESKDI